MVRTGIVSVSVEAFDAEREARVAAERDLANLRHEFESYRNEVERNMESSTTEQIFLQNRLVEQSVQLAETRSRLDEVSSAPRTTPPRSYGSLLFPRSSSYEKVLTFENERLKKELEQLKQNMSDDFERWKTVILSRVRAECLKYQDRLLKTVRDKRAKRVSKDIGNDSDDKIKLFNKDDDDSGSAEAGDGVSGSDYDIDFIFSHVDWSKDFANLDTSRVDSDGSPVPPDS